MNLMPTQNQNLPDTVSIMPQTDNGADTPVQMNVQTGTEGLIDDVANDATENNTSTTDASTTPSTSVRDAFAALLNSAKHDEPPRTQEQNTQPLESTAQNTSEGAAASSSLETEVDAQQEMSEPITQNAFNAPLDKESMRSILQEELQKAIDQGKVPAVSQQTLAADISDGNHEIEVQETTSEEPTLDLAEYIKSDDFYSKFSDDPGAAIMEVAESMSNQKNAELQKQLKPLLEQSKTIEKNRRVQDAIRQFADRGYNDFGKYRQSMVDYLKQGDFDMEDPNAYELAYNRAKVNDLEQLNAQLKATQGRTLADYVSDPASRETMAQDENVKRIVINEYLKNLSSGEKPQVISDSTSNTPTGNAPVKAKSFKEAGEMFKRMF
jgi:hypothetical protein